MPVSAIVIAAYATLVIELVFLSVPSEVSIRQLLQPTHTRAHSARLGHLMSFALVLLLFLIPPAVAFVPGLIDVLIPLRALRVPEMQWLGLALLALSRFWVPFVQLPLRRALAEGALARSGAFAYSRHPGLIGMFAFYLGSALLLPCVVLFAGFPFYVRYMRRRALMEEARLRARFPEDYAQYAARVPRFVGIRYGAPA